MTVTLVSSGSCLPAEKRFVVCLYFIADIYCVFNSVLVRVAVCSKCIIIQIEI